MINKHKVFNMSECLNTLIAFGVNYMRLWRPQILNRITKKKKNHVYLENAVKFSKSFSSRANCTRKVSFCLLSNINLCTNFFFIVTYVPWLRISTTIALLIKFFHYVLSCFSQSDTLDIFKKWQLDASGVSNGSRCHFTCYFLTYFFFREDGGLTTDEFVEYLVRRPLVLRAVVQRYVDLNSK